VNSPGGLGISVGAFCVVGGSAQVTFDYQAPATSYTVSGSYELSTAGGSYGALIYNGSSTPPLAQGGGAIDFTQGTGTTTSFLYLSLVNGTGTMSGDVHVIRAGKTIDVQFALIGAADHCLSQVTITPAS